MDGCSDGCLIAGSKDEARGLSLEVGSGASPGEAFETKTLVLAGCFMNG